MDSNERIKKKENLEQEKKELVTELYKLNKKPQSAIFYTLLIFGLLLIAVAILYSHTLSAFIGIALTFWGALLLYIKPTRFIRKEILDSTIIDSLKYTLKLLNELDYRGTPVYCSIGTLSGLQSAAVYITKSEKIFEPKDEQMSSEKIFTSNPMTMKITPPGLGLSKLLEDELKTNFSLVNLNFLQHNLEKALVDELEIARLFKLEYTESNIHVEIKETIFDKTICDLDRNEMNLQIGDPLHSAIACILTRSTRRPVIIEKIEIDSKEKIIKTDFKLI